MISRSRSLGALLLAFVLVASACGSDSDNDASAGSTQDTADTESASTGTDNTVDGSDATTVSYQVVDTDQSWCFSGSDAVDCGDEFVGQDAEFDGVQPSYQENGDGTVTDVNTGLMWIQDAGEKTYYADALEELETYTFAGYDDWRLPTIKELYSLALFSGVDASLADSSDVDGLWPLIDEDYFVFLYGDETGSNRVIDAQWLTSSVYTSQVNGDESCFFGFNFSDGRIKCYRLDVSLAGGYFAQYVRGNPEYGVNEYVDNGDGTISDVATGLTWQQGDDGEVYDWNGALEYCSALSLGGSDDWRLPNIKELHSIVDYGRSPDATQSAAIDPIFTLTSITNEAGEADWGSYWSSTTLISYPDHVGWANYISFGRALGYQEQFGGWVDVHGAGAQRSDPKVFSEDDAERFEFGNGPQGDAVRGDNPVLCVTGGTAVPSEGDAASTLELSDAELSADAEVPAVGDTGDQPAEGAGGDAPTGGQPDLAAAAELLGISEQELIDAFGDPPPDLEAAAETLGISVAELEVAIGQAPLTD